MSRLLMSASGQPSGGTKGTSPSFDHRRLLGKYDVVSHQPMNEPTLQNVCELLSPADGAAADNGRSSGSSSSNAEFVDVITLEYATGSRGGTGLPYRLRKEYLVKALAAGVTFEVNYASAVVDPRRRQGLVRTLGDFASVLGGVQKRHALLNGAVTAGRGKRRMERSDGFPLFVSSGPRQNYTKGTDESVAMSLRSPDDVGFMVSHLAGGALHLGRMCAADRVLARARDRRTRCAVDSRPGGGRAWRRTRYEGCGGDDGPEEGSDDVSDDDGMPGGDIVAWLSRAPIKGRGAPPGGDESNEDDVAADYKELLANVRSRRGAGEGELSGANDADEGKVEGAEDRVEQSTGDGGGGRGDANEDLGDGFIAF